MSELHKSHRLGDLLVEAGLITALQLREAIALQQERRINVEERHTAGEKFELGEILIELGFINRHQLKIHLSWQRRLRKTTAIMVFIAPLLTAACGGGGGGGNGGSSGNNTALTAATPAVLDAGTRSSSSSSAAVVAGVPSAQSSNSEAFSSLAAQSSSAQSSKVSSFSSSSSSVVKPIVGAVDGPVQLYWSIPTTRENGEILDVTEIGGYELRYKLKGDATYTTITIKDGFTDAYYFDYLKGDYQFEIATFDKDGLYSDFVAINPY